MAKASVKTVVQTIQEMGLQVGLHAVRYNATVRTLNRRFGQPRPRGRFHTLGDVKGIERHPHSFVIHADNGYVEVDFISAEMKTMERIGRIINQFKLL